MKKGNTTNSVLFRKKLAQAIALTSVVGLGLAACSDGDRSTSNDEGVVHVAGETTTDASVNHVEGESTSVTGPGFAAVQPTGSITGLVQDSNGNPLEGVQVYAAGQSATTDAGGVYYIEEIQAVNTLGTDSGTVAAGAGIPVSIRAPDGYLGGTAMVTPQSQIDGSPDDSSGIDNEENCGAGDPANGITNLSCTNGGTSVTNPQTVFIDGFVASAGIAILPAKTACITGVAQVAATGKHQGGDATWKVEQAGPLKTFDRKRDQRFCSLLVTINSDRSLNSSFLPRFHC